MSPISRRETQMVAIPATYSGLNSSPGVVVGIVLGTVGGFIIVVWLLYMIFSSGGDNTTSSGSTIISEVVRRQVRRRPEVVEVRVARSTSRSRHQRSLSSEEDDSEVSPQHRTRRPSRTYRTVDPREYGGGDRPARHVRWWWLQQVDMIRIALTDNLWWVTESI
jgi:hypothetical protein